MGKLVNMKYLDSNTLDIIRQDLDQREELIRKAVYEALFQLDKPDLSESIVASYFICARNLSPAQVGKEICYHMTSGVRKAEAGSLLEQCTGKVVDSVCFDKEQRCGLVRVAFPLKMLLDETGNIFSTDILHIAAGAGVFALRENKDAKLVDIAMSDKILAKFPGPAYGAAGLRKLTNFGNRVAFGTILKPCTGITPQQEAELVYEAAKCPLFMFIKEDENFMPGVSFAPVAERAKYALKSLERAKKYRDGAGIIFATHVTSPPHLIKDYVKRTLDAGVNGLMFSEYYCGGAVRMVREMTKSMDCPPVIYGHNGGIDTHTRHIYREVLDMFARLDGIDIRQTAPVTAGMNLLRPYGLEWRKCEEMLSKPLGNKPAVMISRAGGLDQGNIITNLLDVSKGMGVFNYLFLAGSAINGIKDSKGNYDPRIGAEAMKQALGVFEENVFTNPSEVCPANLKAYADSHGLKAFSCALAQRYNI